MKTSSAARLLAALLLAAAGGSVEAAQSATTSLTLSGVVQKTCEISIVGANTFNLTSEFTNSATGTDVTVGTVREKCNTAYRLAIKSDNNLRLKSATGASEIPYSVNYDGTTTGAQNFTSFVDILTGQTRTTGTGRDRTVKVSYSIPFEADASATYTDTIQFRITAE